MSIDDVFDRAENLIQGGLDAVAATEERERAEAAAEREFVEKLQAW
jgi:hypothetical protein